MSFISNLEWRYATKKFNGLKVEEEKVEKIKKAIRFAPSSFGAQPYHVVIVENKEILEKLKAHAPDNEKKFDTCSHMFVFCARTDIQDRFEGIEKLQGRPKGALSKIGFSFQNFMPLLTGAKLGRVIFKNFWAMAQTYTALGFGLSACAELEVDSCPMEGFHSKHFSEILNFPGHIKPVALMAIGYRAEDDKIYPKTRFPENDIFTEIK